MTVDLSKVEFTYDFFSSTMPDGSTLILNNVSEDFFTQSNEEVIVKQINILIQPIDGSENILCSSVIGCGNDRMCIKSDYSEYFGKVLTEDNMKYCTIEMYEVENE